MDQDEHDVENGIYDYVDTDSLIYKKKCEVSKMKKKTSKGQAPEHKIQVGQVSATIWPREVEYKGEKRIMYSVQVVKSIKVDDEWKNISSFDLNDLPKVAYVTQKAYEYLITKKKVVENDD